MMFMGDWVRKRGGEGDFSKFAAELELNLLGDEVEVTEAAHEGVPKLAEVGAIFHFLCADVARVALAIDVEDIDGAVLNSFAGAVLTEFQVVGVLHGGSGCPDNSGGVFIVDEGRFGVINEGCSSHIKTICQVADGDCKLGTFAGGNCFGFTRARDVCSWQMTFHDMGPPYSIRWRRSCF